jgi:hypothetical protein
MGRTNILLSYDTNGSFRERRLQQFFLAAGTSLHSRDEGVHRETKKHTRPTIILLLHVFLLWERVY